MSNQVYSNATNIYLNQEYDFNTNIVNTTGPVNLTLRVSKDIATKTIKMVFPASGDFVKSVSDGTLTNETVLPESFRPSVDSYSNIYIKDTTAGNLFTLGMVKLQTNGVFVIGRSVTNDLFVNTQTYAIHFCMCEFPY